MSKELEAFSKERQALDELYDVSGNIKNLKEDYIILKNMVNRLEAIDNANPSEALKTIDFLLSVIKVKDIIEPELFWKYIGTIKQALIQAEKEHNSLNLLMQELDCKDFADLRKYARCGYERLNNFKGSKKVKIEIPESSLMDYNPVKKYLKWEDLEKLKTKDDVKVKMNDTELSLIIQIDCLNDIYVQLYKEKEDGNCVNLLSDFFRDKELFNDLHLERVEE